VILLLIPALAMQVSDQWDWNLADFVAAAVLLFGAGATYELVAKKMGAAAYRAAVGIAVATGVLLVWVTGAVGIIGSENDGANMMYGGVLAVAAVGALLARWRPAGMARALIATALAQAAVAAVALAAGWGGTEPIWPNDILMATAFFVAAWLASAALFRKAASGRPVRGAIHSR
jgi:hypothetical protein